MDSSKSIPETESHRFVDHNQCAILKLHPNSRWERRFFVFSGLYFHIFCKRNGVTFWSFVFFFRLFECSLSIAHGFWSIKRRESISGNTFAPAAHLLLLLWASSAEASLFNTENVRKVSIKNVKKMKNEFTVLSTMKKWYDMSETHNLSQRTVDPKLVDDSETNFHW